MNKTIIITIPIYKEILDKFETISIDQCLKVLYKYEIVFICSNKLNTQFYTNRYNDIKITTFDSEYFKSISGYNRLMTSFEFYSRFSSYEYILIYQPDCYVFKDNLLHFSSLNYDYIGAPWLPKRLYPGCKYILKVKRLFCISKHKVSSSEKKYNVGNGGLSLRKVKTFMTITSHYQKEINNFLSNKGNLYNEDIFYSLLLKKLGFPINIPDYNIAAKFAIESNPENAFMLNNQELPFGCHAWYKPTFIKFWKKYIKEI